jgi:DNA replication protein DnaC
MNIRSIDAFRRDKNVRQDLHPKSMEARFMQLPRTPQAIQCEACGNNLIMRRIEAYGEVRFAPSRCACQEDKAQKAMFEKQRQEILEAQNRHTYTWLGGIWTDASLTQKTFANFDASKQPQAYQMAMVFVSYLKGTLVLDGSFGTGKTHLLAAICNAVLRSEKPSPSLFATSANLFAAIQKRIADKEDYYGLLHKAMTTPLLCLDDIDKTKWTEWREEIYFSIVDERTKRGLPMAISTNKLEDLHIYTGGAVASRLKIGQIPVVMIGEDYRKGL